MNGVLVIDKPEGITSFDVIRRLRPALHEKRIGHTGTLDPMATGVLPLCLGEATKIAPFLVEADKEYDAEVTLGEERDTQDRTGKVTATSDASQVDESMVRAALARFLGPQTQVPPMYSAVKVEGERLYEKARRGETVERVPRTIIVHDVSLTGFQHPRLSFRVRCSKGTYVRTLAHDLGRSLGCGAHLSGLRRSRSGPFRIEKALRLDEALDWAKSGRLAEIEQHLVSLSAALASFPELRVDAARERKARLGQPLTPDDLSQLRAPEFTMESLVRLVAGDGRLVAIARFADGGLRYERVLNATP